VVLLAVDRVGSIAMKILTSVVIALLLSTSPAASQTADVERVIRALGASTTREDLRILRQSPEELLNY
jgi:hypothetical protein